MTTVVSMVSKMNIVLMTFKVDFSLKAFLTALHDTTEWLVVSVLSLMCDSVISSIKKQALNVSIQLTD